MIRFVPNYLKAGLAGLTAIFALNMTRAAADDWPQWQGPQRDGIWREEGIVEKFDAPQLKIKWSMPVGGGYSGPAVAGGKVFLTDRMLNDGVKNPDNPFDRKNKIVGKERVLCFDEQTGKQLWVHEYPADYSISYQVGPRATPTVTPDGKVYTLGAEGRLFCINAADGKVVFEKDINQEYTSKTAVWGYSCPLLVDGNKLICIAGGKDACVVAFDRNTGKELWKALNTTEPGYCAPSIIEAGGKRQLIVWHGDGIASLDPETGTTYWSKNWKIRFALSIATPRKLGDYLFFTTFYNGPWMFKLSSDKPDVTEIWRGHSISEKNTEGLHAMIATPFLEDGYIYGVCSYGQFRCVKMDTGERVWETFQPTTGKITRWGNAFIVKLGEKNPGKYILFNEAGELILADLTPKQYTEISRAKLIEPTTPTAGENNRKVVWTHPAYANKCVFARNDKELVCASLSK